MTRIVASPDEPLIACHAAAFDDHEVEEFEAHSTTLGGGFTIRRALPMRERRMVGAWCFLDHIGPAELGEDARMRVRPHPHIGLQTVTWLFEGEVLHRDSLGYRQVIRPGQLNVMTSGQGITHSEESPDPLTPRIHGVQFWVALPESRRHGEATFEHIPQMPSVAWADTEVHVIAGEFGGATSPATWYTPLVGLDIPLPGPGERTLPLRGDFEHGFIVTDGVVQLGDHVLRPGTLLYIRPGRTELCVRTTAAARLIAIGGVPFEAPILMWWNFVGRTRDEIVQARTDWEAHHPRFGAVSGWGDERLDAPAALPAAPHPAS
jgi:redox-sensitive bicupin YhaK (pirin superfamily)